MSIEVWAAFAAGQGWRMALPMAIGVALGDFTAMTLSMLGHAWIVTALNPKSITFSWPSCRSSSIPRPTLRRRF